MIARFEHGGTRAFEAKIAHVGARVVAEITGRKQAGGGTSVSRLSVLRHESKHRVAPAVV